MLNDINTCNEWYVLPKTPEKWNYKQNKTIVSG
jgi:hypothetical protein